MGFGGFGLGLGEVLFLLCGVLLLFVVRPDKQLGLQKGKFVDLSSDPDVYVPFLCRQWKLLPRLH